MKPPMQDDRTEDHKSYQGKGWGFIRLDDWPEWIAAPITVFGFLVMLCLLGVGVSIIFSLVQRVWRDGTDTVQAASAALTAIAAIFGAAFLTWRTIVAHWQARASQDQATVQRETFYTSLFTKAAEQLGTVREVQKLRTDETTKPPTVYSISETEPNLEVRLGAIYALERIARDSERDHWPILEVLCAYIRNPQNCGIPKTKDDIKAIGQWPHSAPPPRVDIQAAVSVMGRRSISRLAYERENGYYLDFTDANLQSAVFFGLSFPGSQFSRAHLESAQMQRANLRGCRFVGTRIDGAGFGLANLDGAVFDFAHADGAAFGNCSMKMTSFTKTRMDKTIYNSSTLDKSLFFETALNAAQFIAASLRILLSQNANWWEPHL
jgi:hypothetical protein